MWAHRTGSSAVFGGFKPSLFMLVYSGLSGNVVQSLKQLQGLIPKWPIRSSFLNHFATQAFVLKTPAFSSHSMNSSHSQGLNSSLLPSAIAFSHSQAPSDPAVQCLASARSDYWNVVASSQPLSQDYADTSSVTKASSAKEAKLLSIFSIVLIEWNQSFHFPVIWKSQLLQPAGRQARRVRMRNVW